MIKYLTAEQADMMTAPMPGFFVERSSRLDGQNTQSLAPSRSRDLDLDSTCGNADPSARNFSSLNCQPATDEVIDTNAAQKVRQSIVYMRQRLNRPLQVASLAASVNISQSHYFAIFKRFTGSTPIDYFIRLRMQQACHVLKTTSASVKEVAGALGYDDPFYFSRVFRAVHGIAPSEYRSRNRGSAPTSSVRPQPQLQPANEPNDEP